MPSFLLPRHLEDRNIEHKLGRVEGSLGNPVRARPGCGYDRSMRLPLALVAAALLLPAAPAAAATARLGALEEIDAGAAPAAISAGGFTVQIGEASGSYAVPEGYSTITSWSHSTGSTSGQLAFKVYRPTGATREFVAVAADTRTVTAGQVHTFDVQIPVRPGDRVGLSSEDVELAFETFLPADRIGFFTPDPAVGATDATDGQPFAEFKLDVAVTVESAPAAPPDPGPAPPPGGGSYELPSAPALTALRISPRAFKARSRPRVTFSLDRDATVTFRVRRLRAGRVRGGRCVAVTRRNRQARRCTRRIAMRGSLRREAQAGENTFRLRARSRGRLLRRGTYALVARPSAGGLTGKRVARRFRIRR
jgi:hypothetical protein